MANDDVPDQLSRQLAIALLLPIMLLATIGVVLYAQLNAMRSLLADVGTSKDIVARSTSLMAQIVDQETGVRGYLLTNDRLFLEPFYRADPQSDLVELERLVDAEPVQRENLRAIRETYRTWLGLAGVAVRGLETTHEISHEALLDRRGRMNDVREAVARFERAENERLARRERSAAGEARQTTILLAALLAVAAFTIAFGSRRVLLRMVSAHRAALDRERESRKRFERSDASQRAQVAVGASAQGELAIPEIGRRALAALAEHVAMDVGAFHVLEDGLLQARAGYAWAPQSVPSGIKVGDGLVGEVAATNRTLHLRDVPPDFLEVAGSIGSRRPVELIIVPLAWDGEIRGVMELGFLRAVDETVLEVLERIGPVVAVAIRSSEYRQRLRNLVHESQSQADELAAQREEMQAQNEELEEQRVALLDAQRGLEEQREALEDANQRLRQKKDELELRNASLLDAQSSLAQKTDEIVRANRYKSEFLANMSHELRTPLNSSLILAKLLADNKSANLTPEQIRYAETILASGTDLLTLINDVLDLSKIEAGQVEIHATTSPMSRIVEPIVRMFEPLAAEKGLVFSLAISPSAGVATTDVQKVQQILKNLFSNALKFTERGGITVEVHGDRDRVRVTVSDTGIGIAEVHHDTIFAAFRQADGTTNRKYGGTGLGLSISRDLSRMLGGDVTVTSTVGQGSSFMLEIARTLESTTLTLAAPPPERRNVPSSSPPRSATLPFEDDRARLDPSRSTLLIVEDDSAFAEVLLDLGRELGFQGVVATSGAEALLLAKEHAPHGVLLDVQLPDVSGLTVLDRLKHDPSTRHIPIHVLSGADHTRASLAMGAIGYAQKPLAREQLATAIARLERTFTCSTRRVLVVEDDAALRESLHELLSNGSVAIDAVGSADDALDRLRENAYQCIVTDLGLADSSGVELLETLSGGVVQGATPIIVYTGRSLSSQEEHAIRRHSDSIVVKGARSPERLLDEVTLFLHQVESDLPPDRQRMLRRARARDELFEGRRVLVVEDDVRNVFALTSAIEAKGASVVIARNGREALEVLSREAGIDLVLMDVMMPEMDGLTATRAIRANARFARLPIIALTAKAMLDDRDECLAAGANDYVAKPLDVEVLLSLLRVWMPR